MKNIILALIVSLGLQTQAQINICDSVNINTINSSLSYVQLYSNLSLGAGPGISVTYDWVLYDANISYSDTNSAPYFQFNTFMSDTLTICLNSTVNYLGTTYNCVTCDSLVFDSITYQWGMMSMIQQPYFCCDSISYWTDQGQGLFVGLDTTGIVHNPDSMNVSWQVCNSDMCYVGDGINAYFGQIVTTDTIKVGYDVYIYENGVLEICSMEEWLIFDQNSFSWVLLNMITTSINELTFNRINDNKIYDLLGKELNEIPVGKLYIRNQKLYITR